MYYILKWNFPFIFPQAVEIHPEVVVTSTICAAEALSSQHLRGLKPETPV